MPRHTPSRKLRRYEKPVLECKQGRLHIQKTLMTANSRHGSRPCVTRPCLTGGQATIQQHLMSNRKGQHTMDNGLYQYRGGRYYGCYWEWNYAVIIDGKFHDIFSSGQDGCPTEKELAEYLAGDKTVYQYDLTNDKLMEFAKTSEPGSVLAVLEALETLGQVFDITLTCAKCGNVVHVNEAQPGGLISAGGIRYQHTDFLCPMCSAEEGRE